MVLSSSTFIELRKLAGAKYYCQYPRQNCLELQKVQIIYFQWYNINLYMQHNTHTRRLVAVNIVYKKHMQIKVKLHKQNSDKIIINSRLFENINTVNAKIPTIAKCAGKTWKWRSLSSTPTYSVLHNVTCVTVL